MKATKNLDNGTDEGWSIQVYSGDRRLLCTLEPAHMWMFFAGLVAGLLIAIIGFQFKRPPEPIPQYSSPENSDPENLSPPLSVD